MTTHDVQSRREFDWRSFFQSYGLILSLLMLCGIISLVSDRFLTVDNLRNVLRQASINSIISIGMMMVILIRGLDLSVGSVLALATVIAADLLSKGQVSPLGAVGVALLVGGIAGAINGALVTWVKIPPFIATLGMMTFARGAALQYTAGQPITGFGELGDGIRFLGSAEIAGIPMPIIAAGMLYICTHILLNHVPFGRYIYAMGNNEEAAYLSGLPVKGLKMFVYIVSGALAAFAGIILMGRLNSAQPTAGALFEFDAIAAVVVGGTSFNGGEGTVWGTLVGVLIIAVLNNGLNLLAVPSFYQDIASGTVIALALLLYRAIR
ncbi:MAG: ribose ABC transporter permease [Anaerolineae bacterium]|nr:ribose ABC transporter permease [Anaerolineae bacterium]MDQ7033714.1 ribose ABC transporter permease [Anaerolineae bacterium]